MNMSVVISIVLKWSFGIENKNPPISALKLLHTKNDYHSLLNLKTLAILYIVRVSSYISGYDLFSIMKCIKQSTPFYYNYTSILSHTISGPGTLAGHIHFTCCLGYHCDPFLRQLWFLCTAHYYAHLLQSSAGLPIRKRMS